MKRQKKHSPSASDIREKFKKLTLSFPYRSEKKYEFHWDYKGFDILRLRSDLFIAMIFGRISVLYVKNDSGAFSEDYKMARNFHTFQGVCGIIDKICRKWETSSFEPL